MGSAVILLALLAILASIWAHGMRLHETLIAACRRQCRQRKLQLLDDTVCLRSVRLLRRKRVHWVVVCRYTFDFSVDGTDRWRATVTVTGLRHPRISYAGLPPIEYPPLGLEPKLNCYFE